MALERTMAPFAIYRRIPIISSGLIQLRKDIVRGFVWTYKRKGLYPGGLISGIKKRVETTHGSVDRNTFFNLKTHNKATFSPVQCCHPAEGGLYP